MKVLLSVKCFWNQGTLYNQYAHLMLRKQDNFFYVKICYLINSELSNKRKMVIQQKPYSPLVLHSHQHVKNCIQYIFIIKSDRLIKGHWLFNSSLGNSHVSKIPTISLAGSSHQVRWQTGDWPSCPTERAREPGRFPQLHCWFWQHLSQGTQMSVPD